MRLIGKNRHNGINYAAVKIAHELHELHEEKKAHRLHRLTQIKNSDVVLSAR